jgi:hypothetical protein
MGEGMSEGRCCNANAKKLNMEFKEEFKGCPIIDPLEEIKMKCDVLTEQNIMLIKLLGETNRRMDDMAVAGLKYVQELHQMDKNELDKHS